MYAHTRKLLWLLQLVSRPHTPFSFLAALHGVRRLGRVAKFGAVGKVYQYAKPRFLDLMLQ